MKGGVILFRGTGSAACRYLEADRSTADDYYLEGGTALAAFTVVDATGAVIGEAALDAELYAGWVDWTHPLTGEPMGIPRLPGDGRRGSPRFAEMVVNTPKSLSVAAALHPEVSEVLDAAQRDAAAEIRRWLAQHSVTRVGPRGAQEVVPVEQLQTVTVVHRTSRAGDPHRHVHFQIGSRVWAAGAWRALDTAALFKQQGAIRALGTAVIAAHPELAATLHRHGLTLNPVTGEVAELEEFNAVMSKRAAQVSRNLARMEAEWAKAHPGETPGPVMRSRLLGAAWAHGRPNKKPSSLGSEDAWRAELADAGYDPAGLTRRPTRAPVGLDDLAVQEVALSALDRCAAGASTWTRHTVQEHVTRVITEHGVSASPAELREFIAITTRLALEDCWSVLPPGVAQPDHVAHLTSLRVVHAETHLADLLAARVPDTQPRPANVADLATARALDDDQTVAAAVIASPDPLVIVEGAAGAGKTTMLAVAIDATERTGRRARVVAPTKKAAEVAHTELGVQADSVAALVYAHGWRWNSDGVWTRLRPGDIDPDTGRPYGGPPQHARLTPGERVIVDEAGMLDQDTAIALLTVAAEAGAPVALVGDRSQLPAVGRGGVLEMAAHIRGTTLDMTGVHRFIDPTYADLTVRMRSGDDPAGVFDRLQQLDLIRLHDSDEAVREHIAATAKDGDAITVATNDDARTLNEGIRAERLQRGDVNDARTVTGSDGLDIGVGDVIQTRRNDRELRVANRQTWTVQHIGDDGTVWVRQTGNDRKHQHTIALPSEYVTEHVHLAYAATAYGVQGATVNQAHTVLTDTLDAAALYVGMTRGSEHNVVHIVAANTDEAREQFVAAMGRDRADRGLTEATRAATEATRGLIEDGPVTFVNTQRTRLTEQITQADRQVTTWEQAVAALSPQQHDDERTRLHQLIAQHNTAGPSRADAHRQLTRWRQRAQNLRQVLTEIEALPITQAAQLIRRHHAQAQKAAERARTERQAQLARPDHDSPRHQPGPGHDLGM